MICESSAFNRSFRGEIPHITFWS